jgi:hypothetical protein
MVTKSAVNKKITMIVLLLVSMSLLLSGCTLVNDMEVKFGWKNKDFEYIKENKIDKIIIQSTRDAGFRFIVTDKRTISSLYDILSSAKEVNEKSVLDPDYVFEMYEGMDKVHKFQYVAGLDKQDAGNFYSDDKLYIVSKRIDNDIIRNLWNIRKPREFNVVYYKSIITLLNKYNSEINKGSKIGINLSDDIDIAKYILSTDLEEFKGELYTVMSNAELVKGNREEFDVLVTVKTYGYKSDVYKAIVYVQNKIEKSEQKYWIMNKHENGEWNINIYNEKPSAF